MDRGTLRARLGLGLVLGVLLIAVGLPTVASASTPSPVFSVETLPSVTPNAFSGLNAVSCPSAGSCVGVGATKSGGASAFAETLSGGTWTPTQISPAGLNAPALTGIWCASLTACIAVGNYYPTMSGAPLIETLVGGTWTATTAGLEPGGSNWVNLSSISCVSITSCVAAGTVNSGTINHVVIETLSGSTWTSSTAEDPTGSTYATVNSIQCFSATSCLAVGYWAAGGAPFYPLLETLSGSTWTASTLGGLGDTLTSLSCPSATSCMAVGNSTSTGGLGVSESLSGSTWTPDTVPIPSGAISIRGLTGVSCSPDASTCVAVGTYQPPFPNSGATHALVDFYSDGSWTATTGIDPSSGDVTPNAVICPGIETCIGVGDIAVSGPNQLAVAITSTPGIAPPQPAIGGNGYWLAASDGGIFNHGDAGFFGSAGGSPLNKPVVGMAATSDDGGYWLVASDGGIFNYGDAGFFGSAGSLHLNKPIVGMAATSDDGGYWLVASDGGIFNYGDAGFFGSAGSLHLNKPIVGMAATSHDGGYWLVASDGGIFNYGDAGFFGSTGSIALNKPIVGMAATSDDGGYWLVASDGGIFNYGDAGFFGSTGSIALNKPIVGMASPDDGGYWLVASDGGIFNYGDAGFFGSEGGTPLNKPIVGMATT